MHDSLDERMYSANKACWRDAKIYRSIDVPWRVKCRRMAEQVDSANCFGSESWETKTMRRLFRFKRKRGCNVERTMYKEGYGGKNDSER